MSEVTQIDNVYLVSHERIKDADNEDVKIIGVYSTEAKAKSAILSLMKKPGFKAYPDGFSIDIMAVDKTFWQDGFGVD